MNPNLGERLLPGEMVVVGDPDSLTCTRTETDLMAVAEAVNTEIRKLSKEEAQFVFNHYELLEFLTTQGNTVTGATAEILKRQLSSIQNTLRELEQLHQRTYQHHGRLSVPEFFEQRQRLFQQLDFAMGSMWYGFFSIFIPVYAFLLLPSLSVLAQNTENFLERTAKIQWGVMVIIYCVSHVPALLILDIPGFSGQNALLLFYLLLIVQISDVLQYICGKLWGKTKVAPVVSPAKTVEGLVLGGGLAVLVGTGMWWITPFTPLQAAGMALILVILGFLGGLVMSAVKRSLGAKDWGSMISGHGGMMDRLDSVCFAAPVFFHITRYFFTP